MQVTLPLKQMTISDKFLAMEQLWENLSQNAVDMGFSPKWHLDVLKSREAGISRGKMNFYDISDVKKRLQKLVDEN